MALSAISAFFQSLSSEHRLQFFQVLGDFSLHLLQPLEDRLRWVGLNLRVDDLLVAVDGEVVTVVGDLLLRNEERLRRAIRVLLRIPPRPAIANIRQVVLFDRITFVVQAEAVGLDIVEPDIGCPTVLREDQNGRADSSIWLKRTV